MTRFVHLSDAAQQLCWDTADIRWAVRERLIEAHPHWPKIRLVVAASVDNLEVLCHEYHDDLADAGSGWRDMLKSIFEHGF